MAKERRRVSHEEAQRVVSAGSGKRFLKLPKGIEQFSVDKPGTVLLDIVPYVIKSEKHLDKLAPGTIWWRLPFFVHTGIGPNNEMVVCPTSLGQRCPMCEERTRLAKNWDENEEEIKSLNFKKFFAYNIIDPNDKDKVMVYTASVGIFQNTLTDELKAAENKDCQGFFDVVKGEGRTLRVRFSEDAFEGRKFIKATKINFESRPAMDEDEILDKTACLEECLQVKSYDELKEMFLQVGDAESESEDDKAEAEDKGDEKPQPRTAKGKESAKDESSSEDDQGSSEDDAAEGEAKFAKGDTVTFTRKGKEVTGEVVDVDGDDIDVKAGGATYTLDADQLTKVDPEADSEDDAKEAESEDDKPELKVGQRVTWDDGDAKGELVRIKEDQAKVRSDDGITTWVPVADLAADEGSDSESEDDAKDGSSEDDAPPPAKEKAKGKDAKEGKSSKTLPVCPHKGGKFGTDCDKFKECDECPHWKACDQASSESAKKK